MYVKGLFEVFKILGRLGIKPKDIIGMGGDVVKMGKSLFNTRVNPKLLQFVEKNQKIPTKILEEIKLHARTLKNATESQKNLFQANIKDLLNAKTPKMPIKSSSPVTSVKQPATSVKKQATSNNGLEIIKKFARKEKLKENLKRGDKTIPTELASESHAGSIAGRVQDVTGKTVSEMGKFIKSERQLQKILDDWDYGAAMTKQSFKKPTETVIEKVIDFKGWTPTVIKGGKDKLATGGRVKFGEGSGFKLYPRASIVQSGETVGQNEDIDVDVRDVNYGITGLYEGNNWFAGAEMDKGNVKVDVTQEGETLFKDTMGKDEVVNFIAGFGDPNDEKFQVKVDDDFENVSIVLVKSFAKGGIANHFRAR